jgi:uncharacterized membrane protein HdeD (DUF308 family)
MQTLQSHHAGEGEHDDLTPQTHDPGDAGRPSGWIFTLGFASLILSLLAIAVCLIPTIALAALPMSLLALLIGLIDVKTHLQGRDGRLALAVVACIVSLAAFVMSVDAASTVRRPSDPTQPEIPRPWRDPGLVQAP